ncbi:hypothetical protein PsYK624_059250 [Phanerochaete sordida]|uniref:DUF221-domain-containing protein n=1 Tax=Phanerochaete sordida TaxID=48140 RepID=A0A9P3LDD7_9APHY|nr:hypothetical protein PsYK624_059250 [Phanerochaete sordida]
MSQVTPAKAQDQDSQTFLTALVTNAAILSIEILAFVFLKHRLSRIYAPRTFLPPPSKRTVDLPGGWWKWPLAITAIPTVEVLQKNGMDAYMFLRFLRLLVILFASITLISCGILIPVDVIGVSNPQSGSDTLTRLSWTNIPPGDRGRYAAHLAVVWVSTLWTVFLVRRELQHYAKTRHEFLISPGHSSLAQARTVLITNVPLELCNEHELLRWASFVPGGVQNIWIYRDTQDLNKDYKNRLKACKKLEKVSSKLIRKVVKAKHKHDKTEDKVYRKTHKAEIHQHALEEKQHAKEQKALDRQRRKEEKQELKALEKRRKEGDAVSRQAEEDYARAHGMSYPMSPRSAASTADYGRPSADTALTAVDSPNMNGYGERKGSVSHREDVDDTLRGPALSRPRQQRTTTSELEAGQYSPSLAASQGAPEAPARAEDDPQHLLDLYAPPAKRLRHRTGALGLVGAKVDSLAWYKAEVARLNASIDARRQALLGRGQDAPRALGSAFIQCNLQMGAHVLAQCVSYHAPLMMYDKYVEVAPRDVIWDNIDDGAYEMRFRYVTSWLGSVGLIVLWFAPVAFVGTLSNVSTLCEKLSWTCWIRDAPTPVPGIIQGVLPPLFLAILFAILPWLLKGLAWYENIPRYSLLSISVYKRFFMFLVIHGFLIVTLSSGFTSAASAIVENPTSALQNLAKQLPNASIFFLTWTLTQGLTGAGSALLQVGQLVGHFIKKWLLGRTPRQAYGVTFMMPKADFGLVLPRMSLLATIALAYSTLSPIINPLATVSFMLFFFSWKFLLTWVFDQPDETETGGQYFPLAINFLFVGMYIEQICLAVLFFLNISESIVFIVEGILMVVLIALTLCAQILLRRSFLPITQFLPMSIATEKMQERWERERMRHQELLNGDAGADVDLFSRDGVLSVVHRKVRNPVTKFVQEVQKNVAKTANIDTALKDDVDPLVGPSAMTSAHAVSGSHLNEALPRPATQRSRSARGLPADGPQGGHTAQTGPDGEPHAKPNREDRMEEADEEDKDFDVHGFDHPSTYEGQPWIWVPRDPYGISRLLVDELRAAGVEASDEGSVMDEKGTVEVTRGPPDQDWEGGRDA